MQECESDRTNRADAPSTRASSATQRQTFKAQRARSPWALVVATGLCLPAGQIFAQEAQEAPAPEAAPASEPLPVVGSPPPPQPVVQATVPEEQPAQAAPEPVAEPEPEEAPEAPMLKIGMGIRTGLGLSNFKPEGQDSTTTLSLHDGVLDSITIRPYLSAALTKNIGVVANFDIETGSGFQLLDAIVQLRFMDELQLWVGQHIPANARNAFHGPFFHNSWNYNLVSQFYPMDFAVRDRGFTFWGLIGGGILKYHASMVDLQPGREIKNARYAGRVTLNLLDPENYYYASGSYFGAQDTLALGAVVQYQKGLDLISEEGDSLTDNDFLGFSFDALFEKNLGTAGVITLEAGYFNFDGSGRQYFANQGTAPVPFQFSGPQPGQSVLAAVSWLAPNKLGIGRLQPNAQFQWANQDAGDAKVVDLGLGYIVDGWNHKWHANYRFGDTALGRENMVQLGAQFQI